MEGKSSGGILRGGEFSEREFSVGGNFRVGNSLGGNFQGDFSGGKLSWGKSPGGIYIYFDVNACEATRFWKVSVVYELYAKIYANLQKNDFTRSSTT